LCRILTFGQTHSKYGCGGQRKRFKDTLKSNMKACDMQPNELESLTADRQSWRTLYTKIKYPPSRTTAYERCRTSAPNASSVINYHLTAASRATPAVLCAVKNWSLLTPTYPHHFRDPEIRRVDGSVHRGCDSIIHQCILSSIYHS